MSEVVVITGASRGLGLGMARRLLERGLRVGVCARSDIQIDSAFASTCEVGRVDVTDDAAIRQFAERVRERFGSLDAWINNAGLLNPIGPLAKVEDDAFQRLIDVNVMGVVRGSRAFLRTRTPGAGTLINISSGAASSAYAGWSAYCASKAAVDRLTECIALEEAASGLRAFAVAPGVIDTDMQRMIRACDPADFPAQPKFHQIKANQAFNSPGYVADQLLALIRSGESEPVVRRLAPE